ncbi:porin family protein [Sediminicola luteus]|nr:porin family protein [Sediminicola luteus]
MAQHSSLGFRFGGGLATFNAMDSGSGSYRFSPTFGLAAKFSNSLRETVSVQTELNYIMKGTLASYGLNNVYLGDIRFNLHYLEVPLMLNLKMGHAFHFTVGGYGAILLAADYDYRGTFSGGWGPLQRGDFQDFDFGSVLGFGFGIPRGSIQFLWKQGLQDISGTQTADTFLAGARNSVFMVSFTRYFKPRRRPSL